MNSDPMKDPQACKMPLTIITEKGERDHWTSHWSVLQKNLETPIGEFLSFKSGPLNGVYQVVGREIATEVGSRSSSAYRDVVRLLIVKKIEQSQDLGEDLIPFEGSYELEF